MVIERGADTEEVYKVWFLGRSLCFNVSLVTHFRCADRLDVRIRTGTYPLGPRFMHIVPPSSALAVNTKRVRVRYQ